MPASRGADLLRGLERLADAVKDFLLDLEVPDEDDAPSPSLPALRTTEYVAAMRARVEDVLAVVAEVVNQLPAERISPVIEQRVATLFADLAAEALSVGLQMRHEAGRDAEYPPRPPEGHWAEKYRRMAAGDWPDAVPLPKTTP